MRLRHFLSVKRPKRWFVGWRQLRLSGLLERTTCDVWFLFIFRIALSCAVHLSHNGRSHIRIQSKWKRGIHEHHHCYYPVHDDVRRWSVMLHWPRVFKWKWKCKSNNRISSLGRISTLAVGLQRPVGEFGWLLQNGWKRSIGCDEALLKLRMPCLMYDTF